MQKSELIEKKRIHSGRVLSDLLSYATPKTDPNALAQSLLTRYGSLAPIMESHIEDLQAIPGVTPSGAHLLNLLPQLTRYILKESYGDNPPLNTFDRARSYLTAQYIGRYYEHCYILCLDRSGHLIECTLSQQGTVDKTPFYIRLLLEAAIRTGAHAAIISHNHPSGTMSASPADCSSTRAAVSAFSKIGVIVLDHIIICDDEAISLRNQSVPFQNMFYEQAPGDPLLEGWFQ